MSLLGWLLESRSQIESQTTLAKPAAWMIDFFGGGRSKAGVSVDDSIVMTVSAFYRGVSIRTNSLAMLPLDVRVKKGRGSQSAENHWAYSLVQEGFTEDHVNFAWIKLMEHNRIISGNAYALLFEDGAGETLSMPPVHPSRIRADRLSDGTLFYWIKDKQGKEEPLPARCVFHIHGSYSSDGISGVPLVDMMRESVGVSLAMQEHGARLFSNGARIGGILKHPTHFSSDEVAKRVRKSFEEMNSGLSNAHRTALLEEGMDWVPISLNSEEAQFLEGRKFEVTEAARWLELPPHMIADLEKSSFNNIEQQGQEFKTHTMQPAVTLWEQLLKKKLLSKQERKKYYFKFNMNALVRADLAARTAYYRAGREWGWLNGDDIAELEDMNPLPEGKGQVYLQPMNYVEAGTVQQPAPAPAKPADPAPATEPIKQRAAGALRRLLDAQMRQICTKEAHAMRNLLKKSAKNNNFDGFLREIEASEPENQTFIKDVLTPFIQSYAELNELSDVAMRQKLAKYAAHHRARLIERVAQPGDDHAALFAAGQKVCDEWLESFVSESDELLSLLKGESDES